MFLAEEAAKTTSNFDPFDLFIIAFTVIVLIGFLRLLKAPEKNKFAIGFGGVSLLVFLFLDYLMIKNWLGLL
ncbi:hypothetical protein SY83_11195 [Paenibacillus swuensis]|uniref:DUF2759 domain-containing protein n=1 Tax=Paenibacillus swuensis TaxID=1178515 RepID=A0A172TI62_9BACL|nr:hypothetical protein [Paenibacillus swuensis]ANE46745.1 hypothetical protein SY83_11195 [Paenibacillus swuensis]